MSEQMNSVFSKALSGSNILGFLKGQRSVPLDKYWVKYKCSLCVRNGGSVFC